MNAVLINWMTADDEMAVTVGWLIEETDESITVCSDLIDITSDNGKGYRGLTLDKVQVVDVTELAPIAERPSSVN